VYIICTLAYARVISRNLKLVRYIDKCFLGREGGGGVNMCEAQIYFFFYTESGSVVSQLGGLHPPLICKIACK